MAISNENTRIQITLPKDIKKQLEIKANEHNRSVSNYVLTLILKDLDDTTQND
ncbi:MULTISPECIES: ribbon-helix-helix domain-containing protein [Bacillus cereus group]|uniref:ribbon-helix-helix domain-containing protein n=1 Tax=Bacillus cereus group TaxID=86661 RepID=UPI000BF8595F|nr:DNA-binding protein [Bacillus cereus]PFR78328.1 DNA-binding protein [Bacillus cereus]